MARCKKCGATGHRQNRCSFVAHVTHIHKNGKRAYASTPKLLEQHTQRNHAQDFTLNIVRQRFALLPKPLEKNPPPPAAYFEGSTKTPFTLSDNDVLGYARLFGELPKEGSSNPMADLRAVVTKQLDELGGKLTCTFSNDEVRASSVALECPGDSDRQMECLELSGYIVDGKTDPNIQNFLNTPCKRCGTNKLQWKPFPKPPPPPQVPPPRT